MKCGIVSYEGAECELPPGHDGDHRETLSGDLTVTWNRVLGEETFWRKRGAQ